MRAVKNNVRYFPVSDENTQFVMDICMKVVYFSQGCHYYVGGTTSNNNNDNGVFNSITGHFCRLKVNHLFVGRHLGKLTRHIALPVIYFAAAAAATAFAVGIIIVRGVIIVSRFCRTIKR